MEEANNPIENAGQVEEANPNQGQIAGNEEAWNAEPVPTEEAPNAETNNITNPEEALTNDAILESTGAVPEEANAGTGEDTVGTEGTEGLGESMENQPSSPGNYWWNQEEAGIQGGESSMNQADNGVQLEEGQGPGQENVALQMDTTRNAGKTSEDRPGDKIKQNDTWRTVLIVAVAIASVGCVVLIGTAIGGTMNSKKVNDRITVLRSALTGIGKNVKGMSGNVDNQNADKSLVEAKIAGRMKVFGEQKAEKKKVSANRDATENAQKKSRNDLKEGLEHKLRTNLIKNHINKTYFRKVKKTISKLTDAIKLTNKNMHSTMKTDQEEIGNKKTNIDQKLKVIKNQIYFDDMTKETREKLQDVENKINELEEIGDNYATEFKDISKTLKSDVTEKKNNQIFNNLGTTEGEADANHTTSETSLAKKVLKVTDLTQKIIDLTVAADKRIIEKNEKWEDSAAAISFKNLKNKLVSISENAEQFSTKELANLTKSFENMKAKKGAMTKLTVTLTAMPLECQKALRCKCYIQKPTDTTTPTTMTSNTTFDTNITYPDTTPKANVSSVGMSQTTTGAKVP